MANEVAVKKGITEYLNIAEVRNNIEGVVGKENLQGFISDIVACVQNNTMLSACTNKSILNGALLAKSINLPLAPHLGYAYLVPFENKKTFEVEGKKQTTYVKEAQFQMGYKGYVQLALRSGQYRKLLATDVRKGEINEYDPFNDIYMVTPVEFEKRVAKDGKGNYLVPVVGYYAKFELNNGFIKEMFMPQEDMLAYAQKYSKAYRSDINKHTAYSFWTTKFEDMAKKTMLRQLLGKWGLLTPELEKAYKSDMAVIDDEGNPEYVDNQPDDTEPALDPMADVIDGDFREIDDMPMPDAFN